jgi:RNA polymerase sigma factor (sigma-70 family)
MAMSEASHEAAQTLDDLYRAYGAHVYRYALAVLGSHPDAEDVTQTTFLSAYRALEQGVKPRKPENWLLTIASNAIKQRFRQESSRPRQVELDQEIAGTSPDDEGPTVGELLAALSKIPPQQRQAIVLREFEGRSYAEIAEILGVTHSALETLLFRARRSLAEELEHQLTCTQAQLAVSRAADGRLGRKERRRLREHLGECPDCARFARLQQRHRRALKGLMLVPVPVSFSLLRGLEDAAGAATLPAAASVAAGASTAGVVGAGVGTVAAGTSAGTAGGGILAGGLALKAAAVASAAAVAGGVAVTGSTEKPAPERRGAAPTAQAPKAPPGTGSLGTKASERSARAAANDEPPGLTRSAERASNGAAGSRAQTPGSVRKTPAAAGQRSQPSARESRAVAPTKARPPAASEKPAQPQRTTPTPKRSEQAASARAQQSTRTKRGS